MKLAVNNFDLGLYVHDICILFSNENVNLIKKHQNADFDILCEWFIDNKLSIIFWGDKTKYILFKLQIIQSTCLKFCLAMKKMSLIGLNHLKRLIVYQSRTELINALQYRLTIVKVTSLQYICQINIF